MNDKKYRLDMNVKPDGVKLDKEKDNKLEKEKKKNEKEFDKSSNPYL
jgi:hypothetical protein